MKKFGVAGIIASGTLLLWYMFQSSSVPTETAVDGESVVDTEQAADRWAGWELATDSLSGATFRYPRELGTAYIHPVEWPPQIRLLEQSFSCESTGTLITAEGKTEMRAVAGRKYCVTQSDEGAAGSIYSQYTYVFPVGDTVGVLTLTLRMPHCVNYDGPEQLVCEDEREIFALDPLIDTIVQSLEIP
jgi:hypothetical protein